MGEDRLSQNCRDTPNSSGVYSTRNIHMVGGYVQCTSNWWGQMNTKDI